MYKVSIVNLLNNYIVNIIDYVLCFTTKHFLCDHSNHHSKSFSILFYYTYIYHF